MRAASAAEEDAAVAVADVVPLLLATFVAELAEASAALKVVPATEELEALAVVPEASEVLQATVVVLPTVEALPATAEALQHMAAVPQVADSEEVEATAIHLAPADQVVPLGGRDASHLTLDTDRPDLPFHPSLHITHPRGLFTGVYTDMLSISFSLFINCDLFLLSTIRTLAHTRSAHRQRLMTHIHGI